MSAEEERQAMLEKIRADMAQTRARLRDMKERKQSISLQAPPVLTPTGIAPPATSTPAPVTTPTAQKTETARSALSEATSAIEKLKAERAKKQLDTANTPANVVIVKKTEGSSLVGKKIDIGGAKTPASPTTAGLVNKPVGGEPSAAPARSRPALGNAGTGKNIRSLADLQKAIQKADRVKKQAQVKGKIDQARRERQKKLTAEERKAIRQSKRLTVELQHSESRVKVDQQISQFMMMMQTLELEWQKGEEERIKREQELFNRREEFQKIADQLEYLSKSFSDFSTQMEHLKVCLDRISDNPPKSFKKEVAWANSFKDWQSNFLRMRHDSFVSAAKFKKMMEKEAQDVGAAPPPPPPGDIPAPPKLTSGWSSGKLAPTSVPTPPPAPKPATTPAFNPITSLLSQIRQGTSLKKLDPQAIEEDRKNRKGNWRQSVQLLQGLQDTLRDALDQRHLALFESDSDEEDDYEDEDWDE